MNELLRLEYTAGAYLQLIAKEFKEDQASTKDGVLYDDALIEQVTKNFFALIHRETLATLSIIQKQMPIFANKLGPALSERIQPITSIIFGEDFYAMKILGMDRIKYAKPNHIVEHKSVLDLNPLTSVEAREKFSSVFYNYRGHSYDQVSPMFSEFLIALKISKTVYANVPTRDDENNRVLYSVFKHRIERMKDNIIEIRNDCFGSMFCTAKMRRYLSAHAEFATRLFLNENKMASPARLNDKYVSLRNYLIQEAYLFTDYYAVTHLVFTKSADDYSRGKPDGKDNFKPLTGDLGIAMAETIAAVTKKNLKEISAGMRHVTERACIRWLNELDGFNKNQISDVLLTSSVLPEYVKPRT